MPTVTVALKHPRGLLLRLFDMVEEDVPVMGGGTKTVKRARVRPAKPVRLFGSASPFGVPPKVPVVGGFAMTAGVDADFMAAWLEQNKDNDLVDSGLLKVYPEDATGRAPKAEGYAKEHAALKSGLEPVDPNNLPKGIQRYKPDDERAAA